MARSGKKSAPEASRFLTVVADSMGSDKMPIVIDNTGHIVGGIIDVEISLSMGKQASAKITIETTSIQFKGNILEDSWSHGILQEDSGV